MVTGSPHARRGSLLALYPPRGQPLSLSLPPRTAPRTNEMAAITYPQLDRTETFCDAPMAVFRWPGAPSDRESRVALGHLDDKVGAARGASNTHRRLAVSVALIDLAVVDDRLVEMAARGARASDAHRRALGWVVLLGEFVNGRTG